MSSASSSGLGAQAFSRTQRTWPIGNEAADTTTNDDGALVFFSLAAGVHWLQWRIVAGLGLTEPEVRVEVGILVGRH
jgi:hypothetical protein